MARSPTTDSGSPKRLTFRSMISVSALIALIAKQANRISRNLKIKPISKGKPNQLLTNMSNKAIAMINGKKKNCEEKDAKSDEFGDGGIWQRSIMMGDKCDPLSFSGVIYYDCNGKQMSEFPLRSPRASPLPRYVATSGNKTTS